MLTWFKCRTTAEPDKPWEYRELIPHVTICQHSYRCKTGSGADGKHKILIESQEMDQKLNVLWRRVQTSNKSCQAVPMHLPSCRIPVALWWACLQPWRKFGLKSTCKARLWPPPKGEIELRLRELRYWRMRRRPIRLWLRCPSGLHWRILDFRLSALLSNVSKPNEMII